MPALCHLKGAADPASSAGRSGVDIACSIVTADHVHRAIRRLVAEQVPVPARAAADDAVILNEGVPW
jgi:hypothetical protein